MNFLLDTDICSAHMRRPAKLAHRFIQYTGRLTISTVTLAELYAGAYRHSNASRLLALIADLLREVQALTEKPAQPVSQPVRMPVTDIVSHSKRSH